MKNKTVVKSSKENKKPTSVLHQLNSNLQNYLDALKMATETNEYQQFQRLNR